MNDAIMKELMNQENEQNLAITLMIISALHHLFNDKKGEWKMIETKAVKWAKLQHNYDKVSKVVKQIQFGRSI